MFRPSSRALLRATRAPCASTFVPGPASRRLVSSTAAPETGKSRSWKNTAVRLGLAAGAVYYYNTSDILSNERDLTLRPRDPANYHPQEDKNVPTIESIKPRIREEREREAALYGERAKSPQELEGEADQEGAFNPETGEINWDCPCLGGMAKGPCGEAFKAAFSCFVYSNEEPKGIDCIEKFKGMQDCFRQYPEIYGSELEDDDAPEQQQQQQQLQGEHPSTGEVATAAQIDAASHPNEKHSRAKQAKADVSSATAREGEQAESDELIPKAWHDTNQKNENEGETKAQKAEK